MWHVEVEPTNPNTAALDIAWDSDFINMTVGQTWVELFGAELRPDLVDIVDHVIAGRVEEAGKPDQRFARIGPTGARYSIGSFHWPDPVAVAARHPLRAL